MLVLGVICAVSASSGFEDVRVVEHTEACPFYSA